MEATKSPVTLWQVLRNRRFLLLWLAQLISTFGDWLEILALFSLIAFRLHGTPYQVAGILISFILPWAFWGPVAGVFVDRWNLKRTMIGSDLIRALLAALLGLASGIYQVYFLVFALSFVSCFFFPAQNSAIPLLVNKEELLVANALNAQTIQFNKIIGPAVAGVLVGWAGEKSCFYVDSVSFLFSAAMLSLIVMARPPGTPSGGVRALFEQLTEGLRFLFRHRALLFVATAMVAAIFALGAFDALIAVYVRDILRSKAQVFGALVTLVGLGTILGAGAIGRFGQGQSKVYLVIVGILGLGVGVFILAATDLARVALLASIWLGLAVSAVLVPSQTLLQEETPQAMLGRVTSTWMSLMTVSQLTAVAIAGEIADWIGIRDLYYVVACALVLIAFFGYLYARANRLAQVRAVTLPT
jgi:DHA3 family macrolide efflux protein-like MFS transporter